MKNKAYNLQLLTHRQIFTNREEAIIYFEDNFKPFALIGEPAIAFYGDEKSPKAIIALGVSDKKIFFIDANDLSEKIDRLSESSDDEQKEIANSLDLIKNVITACGLTLDENKKTNRVTYDADTKDDVIGDTKTLAEAIDALSKFVQKGFKDNELKVEDTESIKLSYKPDATDGKKLTSEVKLSNNGDSDDTDFNDNIICKKSDGLYAAANLEYDEEKHTLTFTSSGYKDGKYKDDAHKKVINLDEHTIVSTENHHHNIELVINKIAGTNKYVISGDARLSEDENNILKIEDDHLIVDGRAKNIKYGDITVAKGLNNLKDRCDDLSDKITDETSARELADTALQSSIDANKTAVDKKVADINNEISATNTKVTKLEGDTSKLSTDVNAEVTRAKAAELKLSQDIASNLSAINNEINRSTNKDTELENKVSSHIDAYTEYKTDNNAKVSVLQNAVKTIEADVTKKYNVLEAKDNQTISDYKAADVTLQTNIEKEAARATSEEGKINYALTEEVARAKAKETDLSDKVNSLDSDYKAADTQLQSTIDGLTTDLTNEVNRATEAENKIKSDLTVEINKKVASVTIEKNSTSDLQYTLYVDGKPSGEVNIPKDQLLTNVEYLAGEKIIRFTFETTSGVKVTDINVANLVDTYIAGDGLTLVDNKFSVKKSDGSQSYLEVTADGVKVVGVDEALALKANAADVYTKDEIEAKGYLTEHQDVSSFVTKDELAEVKTKVNANTSAVTDEVTRAKSAENNLNIAIKANETSITNEVTRATNAETAISDKLNEHLTDVKEYKKSVDTAIESLKGADTAINEKIATNLSDTKASIESVKADYKAADVTLQTNIEKEAARATSEEGKINYALTEEVARAKAKETELLNTIKDNEWDVQKGQHLGGIILDKQPNKEGTDILSASVVLSESPTNALVNDHGVLSVSNQAKDYNLADGKTVQLAIEELQKKVDEGDDNTELNDRLTKCELQVTSLVSNDSKQDAKLTSLETDVENLKKKPSLEGARTKSVTVTVNENIITSEINLASVDNLIRVNEDGLSFDGSIDYGTY